MKNKTFLIIAILVVGIIIIIGAKTILKKEPKLQTEAKNYLYKIKYEDDLTPGASYEVYFDLNYNISVLKKDHCNTSECSEKTYTVNFSNDILTKIYTNLPKLFSSKEPILHGLNSSDLEVQFINGVIFENELKIAQIFTDLEPADYQISYPYGNHTIYTISLKNNQIIVKKEIFDDLDETTENTSYTINFQEEYLNIIKNFLKEQSTKSENISEPYGDNLLILQSLINNDASYLKDLGISNYLFTLEDGKCSTVYMNDDMTFTHYHTHESAKNIFDKQTTTINVVELMQNIDKYTISESDYKLTTNDNKTYSLDINKPEINGLLNSIPDFGICLTIDNSE